MELIIKALTLLQAVIYCLILFPHLIQVEVFFLKMYCFTFAQVHTFTPDRGKHHPQLSGTEQMGGTTPLTPSCTSTHSGSC